QVFGELNSAILAAAAPLDFDGLLSQVGDLGPYQIIMFFVMCLPASLPSAFSAFNTPFVAGMPPHRCRVPEGMEELIPEDEKLRPCFQYNQTVVNWYRSNSTSVPFDILKRNDDVTLVPCQNGWVYDNTTYTDSIVTEFELYCERSWWVEFSTTIFYVGSFIGNILYGYVADKFGRRRSFFIILINLVVCGTANAFVWNMESFVVVRFLVGLPFPALFQIPFIISMEWMGMSGRIFSGLMISMFFALAMVLLGVLAMLVRQWRQLTFWCNAPFAALFLYHFFLPESPRWLVSIGRFDEAKKTLKKIAELNKRDVNVDDLVHQLRSSRRSSVQAEDVNRHNVFDLFRTPNLRKKTILVTYIWVMNAIIYNGLTLNVSNLPVDDYVSFIINGASELPAFFIVWPLLGFIGRRWSLASCMLICGIGCVSAMFAPSPQEHPWVIATMSFVGKFGVGAGFATIYIFAGELYPTVVRAIGMGMSSMVAGSGLLLAPHLVALGSYWKILPLILMGFMSLSAGIATFFLPETLGAPLPQTLEDAENFGKSSRTVGLFSSLTEEQRRRISDYNFRGVSRSTSKDTNI
ncbi:hypothetical protein PMAYCL1PPCAC_23081, partial [Pristionchus mayeri]